MIGSHQLSPEAKEKAAKRRAKRAAEDRKSTAGEREQAQQLKRQEKKQEEQVPFTCACGPPGCVRLDCLGQGRWLRHDSPAVAGQHCLQSLQCVGVANRSNLQVGLCQDLGVC